MRRAAARVLALGLVVLAQASLLAAQETPASPYAGLWLHHGELEVTRWNDGRCVSLRFVEDRLQLDVLDAGFGAYTGLRRSLETVWLVHAAAPGCVLPTFGGPVGGAQRLWQLAGRSPPSDPPTPLKMVGNQGNCAGPACDSERLPSLRLELQAQDEPRRLLATGGAVYRPEDGLLERTLRAVAEVRPVVFAAGRDCGALWDAGSAELRRRQSRDERVKACRRLDQELGPIVVRREPIGHLLPGADEDPSDDRLVLESQVDRTGTQSREVFLFLVEDGAWRLHEAWSLPLSQAVAPRN